MTTAFWMPGRCDFLAAPSSFDNGARAISPHRHRGPGTPTARLLETSRDKTLIGTPDPDQPARPVRLDEHAERMVLAALLTYPSLTAHLTTVLDGKDFTAPAHRQVFLAAVAAHDRGRPCTPAAIAAHLPYPPTDPDAATTAECEQLVRVLSGAAHRWRR